jgi:hypothetical protein
LKVHCVGSASNRSAIGARVWVTARIGGVARTQVRELSGGIGFGQLDLPAHFGLGDADTVSSIRIEWPSGAVQEYTNVAPNRLLTLWEPPAMSAAVRADGACELTIKAEPNRGWQIKASSDLLTWQRLTTLTNTTVGFQFTDTATTGMASRFYRVESE